MLVFSIIRNCIEVRTRQAIILAVLCLLVFACVDLERATPTKRSFHLDVPAPSDKASNKPGGILKIRRLSIEPLFASRNLVYRLTGVEYESDYYSEFLIPPATEIQSITRKYLDQTGLFRQVTSMSSQLAANYILEGNIEALYGDYHQEPFSAVLQIQFTIIAAENHDLLFNRRYQQRLQLENREPASLVEGWSQALRKILHQLQQDLQSLPEKPTA